MKKATMRHIPPDKVSFEGSVHPKYKKKVFYIVICSQWWHTGRRGGGRGAGGGCMCQWHRHAGGCGAGEKTPKTQLAQTDSRLTDTNFYTSGIELASVTRRLTVRNTNQAAHKHSIGLEMPTLHIQRAKTACCQLKLGQKCEKHPTYILCLIYLSRTNSRVFERCALFFVLFQIDGGWECTAGVWNVTESAILKSRAAFNFKRNKRSAVVFDHWRQLIFSSQPETFQTTSSGVCDCNTNAITHFW